MSSVQVKFPKKTSFLFEPHPYKVIRGGRGKGASWSFARALLILGRRRKLFIPCGREIQKSIQESVHKLLADQIYAMGYEDFYDVQKATIIGKNGTKFVFVGIKNNINSIKSMEAIDIFAVFEADQVSRDSWEKLLPTVRRDPPFGPFDQGSEVWVEFNPELETDETYKRWVIDPPAGCVTVEMSYKDNPFFPAILRAQMEEMQVKDPDNYRTVWEGKTRKTLEGAIFAKEIALAIEEKRISPNIKLDRSKPCTISFDLGDKDMCCFWVWQQIGMEHNAVHFYGNVGFGMDHFLDEIEKLKIKVKYIILPHDAAQAHQAARGNPLGNTIKKQVQAVYPEKVRDAPRTSIINRINATRALFPRINMAEGPTSDGLMLLTRYRYKVNDRGQRSAKPDHDESDPADAFTYYAVWLREGTEELAPRHDDERVYAEAHSQGWMG